MNEESTYVDVRELSLLHSGIHGLLCQWHLLLRLDWLQVTFLFLEYIVG
jgi:hypothetical protein